MKKLLLCLGTLAAAVMFCGCSSAKNVEGSLIDLMAKIYDGVNTSGVINMTTAITPDMEESRIEHNLGTANIKFTDALVSEPVISSHAHAIVLIRASDSENIPALMNRIRESNIGWKWICVGVNKDEVIVDNIGNLVVVIIDKNNSQAFHDNFKKLAK